MVKKITAIAIAVIGLVVIILGASLSGTDVKSASSFSYSAGSFDVPGASFGADFYTYMYDASDMIVSELDAMGEGFAEMVDAQSHMGKKIVETTKAVYEVGGMIVIALGLALIAWDIPKLAEAFIPENLLQKKEAVAVEQPTEE